MPLSRKTACCALWLPSLYTFLQRHFSSQATAADAERASARSQRTAQPFSGCAVIKVVFACGHVRSSTTLITWESDHHYSFNTFCSFRVFVAIGEIFMPPFAIYSVNEIPNDAAAFVILMTLR